MRRPSGLFSYLFVGIFFYLAITKATSNPKLFMNLHGLAIVFGGLVVAGLASFPWSVLKDSAVATYKAMNTKSQVNAKSGEEVVHLSVAYQKGMSEFEKATQVLTQPMVKDAANLILEGIKKEFIIDILEKRVNEKRNQIQTHMNVLLTLSKFSPAMGLAATVLGLVSLLDKLATADMGELGAGMAIALCGTFYGIMMSNLLFAPLSELIATCGEIETKEDDMVIDAIDSMLERKNPIVIGELVNSHLPENNRINFMEKIKEAA